jgi:hypothetical protein
MCAFRAFLAFREENSITPMSRNCPNESVLLRAVDDVALGISLVGHGLDH